MTLDFENILDASDELLEVVRNWRNSTSVSQYMVTDHYITPEEHRRWVESLMTKTTAKAWVIRFNGNPVGVVALSNINLQVRTAEWGFYIAEEAARRKGLGSKVLYQLLEYVFDTLRLQILRTLVLDNNPLALKLYEKYGFRKEPTKHQSLLRDGRTIGVFTMSISQGQWYQTRTTLPKDVVKDSKKFPS